MFVCEGILRLFECVGFGECDGHFRNLECVALGMCEYVGCGLCVDHIRKFVYERILRLFECVAIFEGLMAFGSFQKVMESRMRLGFRCK